MWTPAYSQVTFSPKIRYSDALKNSIKQQAIMDEVMKIKDIETNWQEEVTEKKILSLLKFNKTSKA